MDSLVVVQNSISHRLVNDHRILFDTTPAENIDEIISQLQDPSVKAGIFGVDTLEEWNTILASTAKPLVVVWNSATSTSLPPRVIETAVVFVDPISLLPIFHEDRQRILQHFTHVALSTALWLALFKARNICRLNRASFYWQNSLSRNHSIHSFADYYSKIRGGMTRAEILALQVEYTIKGEEEDILAPGERGEVLVKMQVLNADDPILPSLRDSSDDGVVHIIAIPSSNSQVFEKWNGMERVVVVPESLLSQEEDKELTLYLQSYLKNLMPCFTRVATTETPGEKRIQERLKDLKAQMQTPVPPRVKRPLGERITLSLRAFRDAIELIAWIAPLSPSPPPPSLPESFPSVHYAALPDHHHHHHSKKAPPPPSILGQDAPRGISDPPADFGINLVHIPNLIHPKEDLSVFGIEDADKLTAKLQTTFLRKYEALDDIITSEVMKSHQMRQKDSIFRFTHFYTQLPMIRSVETEALLSHITTMLYTHPLDRSLFRIQCCGRVSPERATAWALGVYYGQLIQGGGPGLEVAEIWCDPGRDLTDKGAEAIAEDIAKARTESVSLTKFLSTFVYPLERHVRLKKLLAEGEGKNTSLPQRITGYIEALCRYLR